MRIAAAARDRLISLSGSGAIKPMPQAEIAQAVQLLDLMLEHFVDVGHWTRGRYDDGSGTIGVRALLVHAISDEAKAFYERWGFRASATDPMTLMITIEEAQKMLGRAR